MFFMGSKLWLYQTQVLFIIYAPNTDVTKSSSAGHKKFKFSNLLCFNLVNVHSETTFFYSIINVLAHSDLVAALVRWYF